MHRLPLAGAITVLICSVCTFASAAEVMRERDVTEQVLIEALKPASPLETTRSIRLQRVDEGARPASPPAAPAAPASVPKASLLVTFETGSTTLTQEARQALDVVSRALASEQLAEFRFNVEGHADPRGDSDFNLRLSQKRAEAVRRYLVESRGLSSDRLVTIGKGDREPLNPKNPAASENRRVTFVTLVQ